MPKRHDMSIMVVSQKGTCKQGHKVGDTWLFRDDAMPGGLCLGAFGFLYPYIKTLMYDGSFPWATEYDCDVLPCPDPENTVMFEIKRIPKLPDTDK